VHLEQRRLADSRLAAQHERAAARGTRTFEQHPDLGALAIAPVEHLAIVRMSARGVDFALRLA
jgi:hypothetical protein